MKAVSIRNTQN